MKNDFAGIKKPLSKIILNSKIKFEIFSDLLIKKRLFKKLFNDFSRLS